MSHVEEFEEWCKAYGREWMGDTGNGRFVCNTHEQLGHGYGSHPSKIIVTPKTRKITMRPESASRRNMKNELGWTRGDREMNYTTKSKSWFYEDLDFSNEEIEVEQENIRLSL